MKSNTPIKKSLLLSMAMMLLSLAGWSQSSDKATQTALPPVKFSTAEEQIQQKDQYLTPEERAERITKSAKTGTVDASSQRYAQMLLNAKKELRTGQQNGTLSKDQIVELEKTISNLEKQLSYKPATVPNTAVENTKSENTAAVNAPAVETKQEFNINNIITTDSKVLSKYDGTKTYLTVIELKNFDAATQANVLNHLNDYIIVLDANQIPKKSISRTEFNTYSPEKQEKILFNVNAGNIILTEE